MSKKVRLEVIGGREGSSLYVSEKEGDSGHRVAGPKPWGGGSLLHTFYADVDELKEQIEAYAFEDSK